MGQILEKSEADRQNPRSASIRKMLASFVDFPEQSLTPARCCREKNDEKIRPPDLAFDLFCPRYADNHLAVDKDFMAGLLKRGNNLMCHALVRIRTPLIT